MLAVAVPRGAAATGPRGVVEQGRDVGGGTCAARGVDAVQQRPAARRPDRHRRADHLRADRAGHHLGPDDACRVGDHDRGVHVGDSANRPDRRCRAAGGRPPHPADPGAQASHRRHVAVGRAAARGGHRHPDGGVRRSDHRNGVGSHQDSDGHRTRSGVVHREPALLLPDPADRRRVTVAPIRLPDHRAVDVRLDVHHVAAQAGSRHRAWAGVAADGHHSRHHLLPHVRPDQVGASLRVVRHRGRGDGGAGHGAGVAGGIAVVAQSDGVPCRPCCSCLRCASPPPTAGGTCRATECRSTTRCRRSAESPSAQSSSRCLRSRRCGRSCCTSRTAVRAGIGLLVP